MRVAIFTVHPVLSALSAALAVQLTDNGHKVVERNIAAFDGQSENADTYILMIDKTLAEGYADRCGRFLEIFEHSAVPASVDQNEETGAYTLTDEEELLARFGVEAGKPSLRLSELQAKAIQLGVPFDASTSTEDLARAIEHAAGQQSGQGADGDTETEEQKILRQRLDTTPDDEIRKIGKDEYDHRFAANAKRETMVEKLVELEGLKHG